jgi:HD superfamily phosphohydrolase
MNKMGNDKFRDPIHEFIEIRPYEKKIIDSQPFQRLRNIKQLALTNLVYHGAEHTRFGHSIGVMHLVTKAFHSVVEKNQDYFDKPTVDWYEQILRLIALTHDLGHAPFSHASEELFPIISASSDTKPKKLKHEDFTDRIIKETCIGDYIREIGNGFVVKYGIEYNITPELICEIYNGDGTELPPKLLFLRSFMDSELDCDKMDYLLRDSFYCGVSYGKYDIDRLLKCMTLYEEKERPGIPRLGIESGGIQAFEGFILARYFMFVQVYFHRTRRYFDIMLAKALKEILPNSTYPADVDEYLDWDDVRVLSLLKQNATNCEEAERIIRRKICPRIYETKVHPEIADIRFFNVLKHGLMSEIGQQYIIEDSADKVPHKIPVKVEVGDEMAIAIVNSTEKSLKSISEESYLINKLTEKIHIERLYVTEDKVQEARQYVTKFIEQSEK